MSKKYDSKLKRFKPPHVVFFSNFLPKQSKWSKDRVWLVDLDVVSDACKPIDEGAVPSPPAGRPLPRGVDTRHLSDEEAIRMDNDVMDLTGEDESVRLPDDPFAQGFC